MLSSLSPEHLLVFLQELKLKKHPQPTIIFCNKTSTTFFVSNMLNENDLRHIHLHARMRQQVDKLKFLSFGASLCYGMTIRGRGPTTYCTRWGGGALKVWAVSFPRPDLPEAGPGSPPPGLACLIGRALSTRLCSKFCFLVECHLWVHMMINTHKFQIVQFARRAFAWSP